jgi:hypothetical protein
MAALLNFPKQTFNFILRHGLAFLAHLALIFYGMALFIVGGDFLAIKIFRETTERKIHFSSLINLSMKFGSLSNYVYIFGSFCADVWSTDS